MPIPRFGLPALALVAAASAAAEPEGGAAVRQDGGPGFAFEVPAPQAVRGYGPGDAAIGQEEAGGWFRPVAEVRLAVAGEGADFPSFESFALADLRAFCAADGTGESIHCAEPQARQPFVSASGLRGEVLYLRRVHDTFATGERVVDGWGPIFLFDVSALVPGDGWAALSVRPPLALGAEADAALLRGVAESLAGPVS